MCGASSKTNCSAVMSSAGSHFLGFSWSVLGTGYFMGCFLYMLIDHTATGLVTTACLHLLVLPYIAYSIYYQKQVVKQWCPLCLGVLAVILALGLTALLFGMFSDLSLFSIQKALSVAVCIYVCIVGLNFLEAYAIEKKDSNYYRKAMMLLKSDVRVFSSLLQKGREVPAPEEHVGIVI